MHEAALAESILKIALDTAEKNNAKKILEVGLKIGDMAGVEIETLKFSFDISKKNTPAENAKLTVKKIPIKIEHYNFFCPECDGILILQSGRELMVEFVDCE